MTYADARGTPMFDVHEATRQAVAFHGHLCPGLAVGVRAAELALREIGPHSRAEEVVAVVETDMCAVDAIQSLTGCTFGKGNLVYRDFGKNAFTFFRRSDGRALRLATRPEAWGPPDPAREALAARVRAGQGTPEERRRFQEVQAERSQAILAAPLDALFTVSEVTAAPPRKARVHRSLPCAACGESVMETRVRQYAGQTLCIPCFEQREARP
jgi:formylmethanofuran dehydrogenase subunit E